MTSRLSEGNLQIEFPPAARVRKFDDSDHGLSHCMKAVDFIVELSDRYLFIEFKDPEHPQSKQKDRAKFVSKFLTGNIDDDLKYKCRDTFLYEWAAERTGKPIYYYVLVAIDTLTPAELLTRTDDLRRKVPVDGPASGVWQRKIIAGCAVFNIATWNANLPTYSVSRVRS
jgi:hypothetical protein